MGTSLKRYNGLLRYAGLFPYVESDVAATFARLEIIFIRRILKYDLNRRRMRR